MTRVYAFEALKPEYSGLWANMQVRSDHRTSLQQLSNKIFSNRPRYDVVAKATGVPWWVIGIIHQMECGLSFSQHLHNGDSLRARTHQVPAGRPPGDPPFTWEASAIDALTMPGKEFNKITDWCVERAMYVFELYNGFGYRQYHPEVHSAYLWSYTTLYTSGKYIADRVWSSSAVSAQPGAMAILKTMIEIDAASIDLHEATVVAMWPKTVAAPAIGPAPTKVAVAAKSKTVWHIVGGAGLTIAAQFHAATQYIGSMFGSTIDTVGSVTNELPDIIADTKTHKEAFMDLSQTLGTSNIAEGTMTALALAMFAYAIWRHVASKHGAPQPG